MLRVVWKRGIRPGTENAECPSTSGSSGVLQALPPALGAALGDPVSLLALEALQNAEMTRG